MSDAGCRLASSLRWALYATGSDGATRARPSPAIGTGVGSRLRGNDPHPHSGSEGSARTICVVRTLTAATRFTRSTMSTPASPRPRVAGPLAPEPDVGERLRVDRVLLEVTLDEPLECGALVGIAGVGDADFVEDVPERSAARRYGGRVVGLRRHCVAHCTRWGASGGKGALSDFVGGSRLRGNDVATAGGEQGGRGALRPSWRCVASRVAPHGNPGGA